MMKIGCFFIESSGSVDYPFALRSVGTTRLEGLHERYGNERSHEQHKKSRPYFETLIKVVHTSRRAYGSLSTNGYLILSRRTA